MSRHTTTLLNSFTLKPVLRGWLFYFIPTNTSWNVPKNLVIWRKKFKLFIKIIINGVTCMNVRRFACIYLSLHVEVKSGGQLFFQTPLHLIHLSIYWCHVMYMCEYLHTYLCTSSVPSGHRDKKAVLGSIELEIQVFVSSLMVVLGIQAGFSAKAESVCNCWAISLVPSLYSFFLI